MELIFGEGTDGDCQATIFAPLAEGGYCVTVEWCDRTDPDPASGGEVTGFVTDVSNARPEGEITVHEIDDMGSTVGEPVTIPIHLITQLEIH